MSERIIVRRSAFKMWLLAVAGIPLVVMSVDVLFRQRLTGALSALIFPASEPQLFEARDKIWAALLLLVGLTFCIWGLIELLAPRPVIEADASGLRILLRGPRRPSVQLSWDQIDDLGAEMLDDDGDRVPALWLRVTVPDLLPANPWGARWIDQNTLAVLAVDWEKPPTAVAEQLGDLAVQAARQAQNLPSAPWDLE
jgi:hypothetical protein